MYRGSCWEPPRFGGSPGVIGAGDIPPTVAIGVRYRIWDDRAEWGRPPAAESPVGEAMIGRTSSARSSSSSSSSLRSGRSEAMSSYDCETSTCGIGGGCRFGVGSVGRGEDDPEPDELSREEVEKSPKKGSEYCQGSCLKDVRLWTRSDGFVPYESNSRTRSLATVRSE